MIPYVEIEDQFLRLKEVLNCKILIEPDKDNDDYEIYIIITDSDKLTDINKEVDTIMRRIESYYPTVVTNIIHRDEHLITISLKN